MSKPILDLSQPACETFYACIGQVSLRLVEHNVDAITATTFLREVADAGGQALSVEQVMSIAQNYVEMGDEFMQRSAPMYVSRLTFHTHPGKTHEVEQELHKLLAMVSQTGGAQPRVLRNHFASPGAPDVVFEQEFPDLETLETQIKQVTEKAEFQQWSTHMSELLAQSPKREVYRRVE